MPLHEKTKTQNLTEKQAIFMASIRSRVCRSHMESLFLYHAAPVLRGAKPGVLIALRTECSAVWRQCHKKMCHATGLSILEIHRMGKPSLFLLYEKAALKHTLASVRARGLLQKYGYDLCANVEVLLQHLAARFYTGDFPHESGLFLGYPPGDVEGYIANSGKNYLCCHHWKAYENPGECLARWRQIDQAQSDAIDILRSLPPVHIAVSLLRAG